MRNFRPNGKLAQVCFCPWKSHFQTGVFVTKCNLFVSNSSLSSHYAANIGLTSLSGGTWARRLFTNLSCLRVSLMSTVTESSITKNKMSRSSFDEAELTDQGLNQILCAIEGIGPLSREVCNGIKVLCKLGSCSQVANLLEILEEKGIFLGSEAYDSLLANASERGDVELSIEIFINFLKSSQPLGFKSYINLAKAFVSTDDCTMMLDFITEICQLASHGNVLVMNRIIYAFGECGHVERALMIFSHMKSLNCKPDLVTYNTVLGILGRNGQVEDMLRQFDLMNEANIIPDIVTYNTLINILQKFGRLDLRSLYLKDMDKCGLVPDLRTYTALIESFGRAGNTEESLRLLSLMKDRQIKPSIYIYRSLINNLKKMGRLEVAASLSKEMTSSLPDLVGPKDFKKKNR